MTSGSMLIPFARRMSPALALAKGGVPSLGGDLCTVFMQKEKEAR